MMRPVEKKMRKGFGNEKHELASQIGEFCSYCEQRVPLQHLHLEHIYPQQSHPRLANKWRNFLLACVSCNINKRHYLGDGRQLRLLKQFFWPHIDNTAAAFKYDENGRVLASDILTQPQQDMANKTISMIGLMKITKTGLKNDELGLAYDSIRRRKEIWEEAQIALRLYNAYSTDVQSNSILNQAHRSGYFSIWMEVFKDIPLIRHRLIARFKARACCFNSVTTMPVSPRPGGRI